jgi:S-DNA-T family DNA segregation ATPase FtsK/SpoIIIE
LLDDSLVHYLNLPGAAIVTVSMVLIALYLSTTFSFSTAQDWLIIRFAFVVAWRDRWRNWRAARAKTRAVKRAVTVKPVRAAKQVFKEEEQVRAPRRPALAEPAPRETAPEPPPQSLWDQMPRTSIPDPEPFDEEFFSEPEPEEVLVAPPVRPKAPPAPPQSISVKERADADVKAVTLAPRAVSGFRLPPSTLLHRSDESQIVREDDLRSEAKILVEKCAEFDVRGQVVQINPGPVVTTFEFRPEAGVKYSRVTGLAEDLCLAMRAESILIERMAGKSTVGIQVPNHDRETIWLREVIESENFAQTKSKLTLAMGKDINGRIVTADLATMPHVLIAGSTGSGKSVAINAMIMSVLYKATPEQVRMILVDPKRVELGMYEGIPHLFTPIITEPKLAANALRNAVREMERRLKLLASRSVRNIDQYNKLFDNQTPSLFEDAEQEQPLPHIIIIIDELADLMMLDKANVEEAITRLAQMARAVGIHLVLATQRPSVDVITGLIKANVPTRISFRLATKVDSRTILDSNGAEALLGRGDMLFLPPGTSRLQRLHAPFVTEKETAAVVEFWKNQGEAEYVQGFLESPRDEKGRDLDADPDSADDNDELFEDAVRLVLEFGKASTSLLQRRLRIGYGRAAHLIDMMERDGIVGPADGSKPREILKPPDWLNQVEAALR